MSFSTLPPACLIEGSELLYEIEDSGVSRVVLGSLSGDSWRLHRVKSGGRWTGYRCYRVFLSSGSGGKGDGLHSEERRGKDNSEKDSIRTVWRPFPASWEAAWPSEQQRESLNWVCASLGQRLAECAKLRSEKPRAGGALRSAGTGHFEVLGSHPRLPPGSPLSSHGLPLKKALCPPSALITASQCLKHHLQGAQSGFKGQGRN